MKKFEVISEDIALKMIEMLMAESGLDLFFSNKLQQVQFLHDHVIPQRDFFVNTAKQFDLTMAFIHVKSMASIPISKFVKDTFLFSSHKIKNQNQPKGNYGPVLCRFGESFMHWR